MNALFEILNGLRMQFAQGHSIQAALDNILSTRTDPYSQDLIIWLKRRRAGQATSDIVSRLPLLTKTGVRKSFLHIMDCGFQGSPIDGPLEELQAEFAFQIENQIERRLQLLPIKLILPLVLFILPSLLILIIGPLFLSLTKGL